MENHTRAEKVRAILAANYDSDDAVCDLLADLRHFCDGAGLDFAEQDRVAYGNYAAEKQGI